jgi:hypothetical protein
VGVSGVGVPIMEVVTRISVIEPNSFTNWWRVHSYFGPGYGYSDQYARGRHYLLQQCPGYDPMQHVDGGGIITHRHLNTAVKVHSGYIHQNFTLLQRQAVGAPAKYTFMP